jgi:hypothetical protein
MKKVVRNVARFLLWIVTGAIPFVIAACYGVLYQYQRNGKVLDAVTRNGIEGIEVNCMVGDAVESTNISYSGGAFYLEYNTPCDEVRFTDVDGATNGSYQSRTIPLPASGDIVVELTPEP